MANAMGVEPHTLTSWTSGTTAVPDDEVVSFLWVLVVAKRMAKRPKPGPFIEEGRSRKAPQRRLKDLDVSDNWTA